MFKSITSMARWAFNIHSWNPTEEEVMLAISCIQREEKERIGRFVFKNDAKSSLIGRLLMRKYIFENTDCPYAAIRFSRDDRGKPYFTQGDHFQPLLFNVSHQGHYVVLAGEQGNGNLGVDVMKVEYGGCKSIDEYFRIMNRQFSSKEWVTINGNNQTSSKEKIAMFCRHWCLKESYVKALGVGITVNLQNISFKVEQNPLMVGCVTTTSELSTDKNWRFEETLLDADHCVAVALKGDFNCSSSPLFKFLTFDEIMKNSSPFMPKDVEYCKNFLSKETKRQILSHA